jgi:DNA-binding HxlR family transcriptional regulator
MARTPTPPSAQSVATGLPEHAFADGPFSPIFHHAAELVGKRWTGAILFSLFHGLNRFSELANGVPGVSRRMVAERLKELEREGVISRRVYSETPVRIEYALTDKGLALRDVLIALNDWAVRWAEAPSQTRK